MIFPISDARFHQCAKRRHGTNTIPSSAVRCHFYLPFVCPGKTRVSKKDTKRRTRTVKTDCLPTCLPRLLIDQAGRIGSRPFASVCLPISQCSFIFLPKTTQQDMNDSSTKEPFHHIFPFGLSKILCIQTKRNLNDQPTFKTCNSFNPFCINSCTFASSVSALCSRKASFVLRLAYSRKL